METKTIEGLSASVVNRDGVTVPLEDGASFTLVGPKIKPEGDTWLDKKLADIENGEVDGTRYFSELFSIVNCIIAEASTAMKSYNSQAHRDESSKALDRAFHGAFRRELNRLNVRDCDASDLRAECVAYDRANP